MEFTLDYASLAKTLERQELESPTGRASPQVYGQLLAIYLLFNDLASAKFLWKRIPNDIKEANTELSIIWLVGKHMWKKNYSDIYAVIESYPAWPNHLKKIMKIILDSTRQRATNLIIKAYSTIQLSDASKLLGLSDADTIELAKQLGWIYEAETNYLSIQKQSQPDKKNGSQVPSLDNGTELLEKLTDYIMFLESSTK